jgi:uncharacterized protein
MLNIQPFRISVRSVAFTVLMGKSIQKIWLRAQMSSTICEPKEEPGPSSHVSDITSFKQRFTTEQFYVAECNFGLGVFANRDIQAGDVILEIEGPLIDFAETKRRGPRECMAIQIGRDCYIDTQPPGVLVNHSCKPNSGIKGDRYLVALRVIRKGEEIFYDYSTTIEEQSFTMRCLCGEPGCRGIIGDFSKLPIAVQERYIGLGVVMGFISRRKV